MPKRIKSLNLLKAVNQVILILGSAWLRLLEWNYLRLHLPERTFILITRITLATLLAFAFFPHHPLRLTISFGLGLSFGIIVRSFEVITEGI